MGEMDDWESDFDPAEVKRWTDKKLVSSVQANLDQIFTLFDLLPQLNRYDRLFLEQVQNLWLMYESDYLVDIQYNPKDCNGTL